MQRKKLSEFTEELLDLRLELKDLENKLRRLKIRPFTILFYSLEGTTKNKIFFRLSQMILKRFFSYLKYF
jgi:hypothetical protein